MYFEGINFLYLFKFYTILLTISISDAVQQPQLIHKSANPDILKSELTSHIDQFKVLKLPRLCSFVKLEECYMNENQHYLYYDACFSAVCSKDNYYCINGNGFTLHICGAMPKCKRRYRNTVEYDSTYPDYVEVYSVLCPDGYFQFSIGNCFNPCLKDESVVIIRKSTARRYALGFCNYENHYCNPNGLTVFTLASEKDTCVAMDTKCQDTETLLPNCTCSPGCLSSQERFFRSNFICEPQHKRITNRPSIATETTSQDSGQTPCVTVSGIPKVTIKDHNSTAIVISTLAACVIVVLALLCFVYKFCRCHRNAPTRVTKEKIIDNRIVYKATRDINFGNGLPPEASAEMAQINNDLSYEPQIENLTNKPRMENLKLLSVTSSPSGTDSEEQTYQKES